jgi:hypothetical protein
MPETEAHFVVKKNSILKSLARNAVGARGGGHKSGLSSAKC